MFKTNMNFYIDYPINRKTIKMHARTRKVYELFFPSHFKSIKLENCNKDSKQY